MTEITLHELYELFLDTIGRCTPDLRNRSDEEIWYNLYEQFDNGARSFLHDVNLIKLRDAGLIDDGIVVASKDIRSRWLALSERKWTADEIRSNDEWTELFDRCHSLKQIAEERAAG